MVNFFWSPFPTKRSTKNPQQKIRREIRGKIRVRNSKKFGELSFCDFSDLRLFSCIRAGANTSATCIHPDIISLKNLANMQKMTPQMVFSCKNSRECEYCSTACIRGKNNSPRRFFLHVLVLCRGAKVAPFARVVWNRNRERTKKHIKNKHVNKTFTGLSRDFGCQNLFMLFFLPQKE